MMMIVRRIPPLGRLLLGLLSLAALVAGLAIFLGSAA